MSAPATRTRWTELHCRECGGEATVLDTDDLVQATDSWNAEHRDCGTPPTESAWRRLVEQGRAATLIEHGGDAAMMISLPRPSWSDPDRDVVGASVLASCYRSEQVAVASTHSIGWDFGGDEYLAGRFLVSAKLFGNGVRSVGVSLAKKALPEPVGVSLTVAEARQLAGVLTAACELVETD